MNNDVLRRRAAGMRRSVTPPDGTWEKIEARIGAAGGEARAAPYPARRFPRLGAPAWAGLAAAACLVAAASVLVPRWIAPADGSAMELSALRRDLREAEREYAAARDRLLASLRAVAGAAGAGAAGAGAVADVERELRDVDRVVAGWRDELGPAPGAGEWQAMYRLVKLYRSQTAGVARADDLVRSVSYREETQ